jgi:hypothetical protein
MNPMYCVHIGWRWAPLKANRMHLEAANAMLLHESFASGITRIACGRPNEEIYAGIFACAKCTHSRACSRSQMPVVEHNARMNARSHENLLMLKNYLWSRTWCVEINNSSRCTAHFLLLLSLCLVRARCRKNALVPFPRRSQRSSFQIGTLSTPRPYTTYTLYYL